MKTMEIREQKIERLKNEIKDCKEFAEQMINPTDYEEEQKYIKELEQELKELTQ